MAVTTSTVTTAGSSRARSEPALPKASQAASSAAVAAMPIRKKYCTAQGSQAAS